MQPLSRFCLDTKNRGSLSLSAQATKDISLKKGRLSCFFCSNKVLHIAFLCPTAFTFNLHTPYNTPCKLRYTHAHPAASHDCPAKARHLGNCSFPWSDHFIVCRPCQYILYLLQHCQHKQTQPRLMSTATQIVELLASCTDE